MSAPQFTRGPLEVRMEGTLTGVWAEIGQVCIDPESQEEWWRELARTETTHIRRDDAYPEHGSSFLPFDEAPEQFREDDDGAERLANAHLWAAAPELFNGCNALLGLIHLIRGRPDLPSDLQLAIDDDNHRIIEAQQAVAKAQGHD